MKAVVQLAWRNLFRNFRRTSASLITVAFGAAGLLIYQGFNAGIMNQYRENTIRVRYGHAQVFPKNYYSKVTEEPWKMWIQDSDDVEKKLYSVPGVKNVFPRVTFYSFLQKGGINLAGRGEGVLASRESSFFSRMNYIAGGDMTQPSEIVLGKGLAESLDAKVGDRVTVLSNTVNGQLNGLDLTVAGIFHTGTKEFDDSFFRIDLSAAKQLLDTDRTELFMLETTGVNDWPMVQQGIASVLPNLDPIPFEELDRFYYKNSVDFLNAQFSFIRTIILLIVALGIFNTIAVGMLERAGEIGALRANGESRKRLWSIFLTENAFLGLLGGVLGIAIAVILDKTVLSVGIAMPPAPGITRQFLVFLEIQPQHFIQALILPAAAAVVSSLWPVSRLLKRTIPDLLRANL